MGSYHQHDHPSDGEDVHEEDVEGCLMPGELFGWSLRVPDDGCEDDLGPGEDANDDERDGESWHAIRR